MISYEAEELLPIVSELAVKFTSGDSTSVSFEKARQLMEAVIYCIQEAERKDSVMPGMNGDVECSRITEKGSCTKESEMINDKINKEADNEIRIVNIHEQGNSCPSAAEIYRLGKEAVFHKVELTKEKYNWLAMAFCDYGNENLRDTVLEAIPGFFKYYDPVFAPQDTIITMDYPVLNRDIALQGIDAVAAYLDAIELEQFFLGRIRTDIVCSILQEFDEDYKKQFFNISSIVMRHIVIDMLIGKGVGEPAGQEDYLHAWDLVCERESDELQRLLEEQLRMLLQAQYADKAQYSVKEQMIRYFEKDIREFAVQLKNVSDRRYLRNVVAL